MNIAMLILSGIQALALAVLTILFFLHRSNDARWRGEVDRNLTNAMRDVNQHLKGLIDPGFLRGHDDVSGVMMLWST